MTHSQQTLLSWLALGVGGVALVISVLAYNRSGTTISQDLQTEVDQMNQTLTQETLDTGWDARMTSIRTRIEAEEDMTTIESDLMALRQDIQRAAAEASVESQDWFNQLDDDLAQVESQLRVNTAQALESLERAIESARQDVVSENQ